MRLFNKDNQKDFSAVLKIDILPLGCGGNGFLKEIKRKKMWQTGIVIDVDGEIELCAVQQVLLLIIFKNWISLKVLVELQISSYLGIIIFLYNAIENRYLEKG